MEIGQPKGFKIDSVVWEHMWYKEFDNIHMTLWDETWMLVGEPITIFYSQNTTLCL